jgi:hypothetical protein
VNESGTCRHGNPGSACWNNQCRSAAVAALGREQRQAPFRHARRSMLRAMTGTKGFTSDDRKRLIHFGMRPDIPDPVGASVGDCRHCGDPIPPSERARDESAHQICVTQGKIEYGLKRQRASSSASQR